MIPLFRRKTLLSLSRHLGVSALLALISPAWAGTEKFFTPPEAPFAVKLNENIVAVRRPGRSCPRGDRRRAQESSRGAFVAGGTGNDSDRSETTEVGIADDAQAIPNGGRRCCAGLFR